MPGVEVAPYADCIHCVVVMLLGLDNLHTYRVKEFDHD